MTNCRVWVYRTTNFTAQRAVLYDFALSRSGEHPRRVLQNFSGTLVRCPARR
jgi:transposase